MEIRREVEGGYNFLIDQGKPPALPVDSQKFDISGSRHSGSEGTGGSHSKWKLEEKWKGDIIF